MTQPMSRDTMRELKAKTEEDVRSGRVKQIVGQIYSNATQTAKSKPETYYNMELPQAYPYQYQSQGRLPRDSQHLLRKGTVTDPIYLITDPFYIQNMPEILARLQELFPGCDVSHTILSRGTDGKMYDISKLDEKVLPFVDRALNQSCIVIDWS